MAWLDPELDDGAEDELRLLEFFAAVPEPPAVLPVDAELLVPEAAACDVVVDPGRAKASTPAVASPAAPTETVAAPTETVAARSLARPR